MKRLAVGIFTVVLLGLGCQSPVVEPVNEIGGEWFIDFNIEGETFVAMDPYVSSSVEFGELSEPSIRPGVNRVWIQNVNEPVLLDDVAPRGDLEYYEGDDWVLVDASIYQGPGARMPSDTEIVEVGDIEIGVRERGDNPSNYYWKTGDRLYEMYYYSAQGTDVNWEDVIERIVETELVGE